MPAPIVPHRHPDVLRHGIEIHQERLDGLLRQIRRAFQRLVQVGDVGAVMLVVMDPHRLFVDMRLQGVVGIGQWR